MYTALIRAWLARASCGVVLLLASGNTFAQANNPCAGLTGLAAILCGLGHILSTNGQCGTANGVATYSIPPSGTAACSAGNYSATDTTGSGGSFTWSCLGINNGGNDSCSAPVIVDGVCGSGNGVSTTAIPMGTPACSAGSYATTDANGTDGTFNWNCGGINGGKSSSCAAPRYNPPVNGACGPGGGVQTTTIPAGPSACSTGSYSPVNSYGTGGSFTWTCAGAYGGNTASCSAPETPPPLTGSCGPANGVTTPSIPSGSAACSAGSYSPTDSVGSDGAFNWNCLGSAGGANAACAAPKTPAGVNGACGAGNGVQTKSIPTGTSACSAGAYTATNSTGSGGTFNWSCAGSGGGSTASCQAPVTPIGVNGACGPGAGQGAPSIPMGASACTAGSYSATNTTGAGGTFNWNCVGSGGGTTAACQAPDQPTSPVVNGVCGTANGGRSSSFPTAAAACNAGTLQATDSAGTDGTFNWNCNGTGGGTSATCQESSKPAAQNGTCGSANNVAATSAPAGAAACSVGTETVTDSTAADGTFNWTCTGTNGGTTSSCQAPSTVAPPTAGTLSSTYECSDGTNTDGDQTSSQLQQCYQAPYQGKTNYLCPIAAVACTNPSPGVYTCPLGGTNTCSANGSAQMMCSPHACADITSGGTTQPTANSPLPASNAPTDPNTGACLGQLSIFPGRRANCRGQGAETFYQDCCASSKSMNDTMGKKGQGTETSVLASALLGLPLIGPKCSSDDTQTGFQRASGQCHYIGDFCALNIPLVGCVQGAHAYCCFDSELSRIIQEQGRTQLPEMSGFGTPSNSNCRGFTPAEFQSLDFSKIDLSEYYTELQYDNQSQIESQVNTSAVPQ